MKGFDPVAAGERLRELRGNRTRISVAKELKIPVPTLQGYEEGRRVPKDSEKVRLAEFYGKTVQEIFFD